MFFNVSFFSKKIFYIKLYVVLLIMKLGVK